MTDYLAGCGRSDVTGEAAECGMLGYGKAWQRTQGIHLRLRSRAFVFADPRTDRRILLVVNDLPMIVDSVRRGVLSRLADLYGQVYTAANTMITATHTHAGPGGYSHHALYNSHGFRPKTFEAIVRGIVEAVEAAHADLGPARLALAHGRLTDASVNRSRSAFDRNPLADKEFFPDAIDPQTTLLRIERSDEVVGAVNWFPTHGTSMTNQNRLISSDNKGYAGYHWERVVEGVDYLSPEQAGFTAAFAQTNAGDMSPNLGLKPGVGPTGDEFENTRIIGLRQYQAAAELLADPGVALTDGVDSRLCFVNLSDVTVRPEFTGDGRAHRTGSPIAGASAFAGAWADGPAFPGFREGANPVWDWLSHNVIYRLSARLRDAHHPKALVAPAGLLNKLLPLMQERVPVQLLRVGKLYLIGIPGEVTITAGLRLRRTVAGIVSADLADVLVAGYSNGFIHYVTTPEEYLDRQYEAGSTMFGRWELPALQQIAAELATAMRDGLPVDPGQPPADLSGRARVRYRPKPDEPLPGRGFGDVLVPPRANYQPGQQVGVTFVGALPNNDLRRRNTYLEVQRSVDGDWSTVADDGDWSTKFHWTREGAGSRVTITWQVPADVVPGSYRIRYHGHTGTRAFTAATEPFGI